MYSVRLLKNDGKIQVGEMYFSKWRSENKFYDYSVCAKIEDGKIFPTEGVGSENGFPLEDGVKMKAFLCSDEIQINDEVRHSTSPEVTGKYLHDGMGGNIYVHFEGEATSAMTVKKNCFRIVAEISPNAIWVKPSDRLRKDEVKLVLKEGDMRGIELSEGELMPFVGRSYKNVVAHVKGLCGHFH